MNYEFCDVQQMLADFDSRGGDGDRLEDQTKVEVKYRDRSSKEVNKDESPDAAETQKRASRRSLSLHFLCCQHS